MDDFDVFFSDHYARVVQSLRLAGGDVGESEDAAQEAFSKAMLRWNSVSALDRPATWVYVVAVRELRRRARRRPQPTATATESAAAEASAPDHAGAVVASEVIEHALRALAPRQRLAVALRFHADLTVPEVSRVMRCSEGTVKSTLHTALERLRVDLGDRGLEGAHDGS